MVHELDLIDYNNTSLSSTEVYADSEMSYIPDDLDIDLANELPFR